MTLTQDQFRKEDFVARRRLVRRQQSAEHFKIWWRYGVLIGLVGASIWLAQGPVWELSRSEQIIIAGQQVLSNQIIVDLLGLELPLRIFEVEPGQLRERLVQEPLILNALVYRQLWPPQVAVTIQEREPVAVAPRAGKLGVLDQDGTWLSLERYPQLTRPKLQVVGYTPQWQRWWQTAYPQLAASAVSIDRLNLTNPSNIMLGTALGPVHLGRPDVQGLAEQLVTLDQLRQVNQMIPADRRAFIDLTSPAVPQVRQKPAPLQP